MFSRLLPVPEVVLQDSNTGKTITYLKKEFWQVVTGTRHWKRDGSAAATQQ